MWVSEGVRRALRLAATECARDFLEGHPRPFTCYGTGWTKGICWQPQNVCAML